MDPATQQNSGAQGQAASDQKQYNVPAVVQEKYPELVELIKKTESMSYDEREYWFQILPIMTDNQVDRLRKILEEEKSQLAKLDEQYHDELSKLNKKHLQEWKTFEKQQEREAREKAEASNEAAEKQEEEALLQELDNL